MDSSNGYILWLGHRLGADVTAQSLSHQVEGTVFVADSTDQAVARIEQSLPYLVILSGAHQNWSQAFINRLRETVKPLGTTTIVALTQSHEPSWPLQDENPGIDGFLVEPLSQDVLHLLVKSAVAKTTL